MTWHRTGDKPLSESIAPYLLTHTHTHIYIYASLDHNAWVTAGCQTLSWINADLSPRNEHELDPNLCVFIEHHSIRKPVCGHWIYPIQIESKQTLVYVPWTVKDRTHGPALNHWGRVTHICVSKLTIIGSYNGLSPPSHYLKQCWNIVKLDLGNKFQWNLKRNWYIFIEANAFENVVWKMVAILSRPQCVKKWLCYSGHRVALVVHRAQKSVPDSAGEWPTFLPPPLESCSGTANVDGPKSPVTASDAELWCFLWSVSE